MSNALTVTQLPAHLQALLGNQSLTGLNQAAAGGISAGSWPRISIKGSRFRLQDPQGQEVVIPQHWLDVVIVDANPHMSKIYFKGAYDPSAEGSAPDCYSDNGVGPSARSSSPQSSTCATCPHNVWGSKIAPNGAQVKACADVKKIAVLMADNTSGPVFELRAPGASLGNLGAYIRALDGAGKPAACLVTRIMFDTSADYPKLMFNTPVIDQTQPLPWAGYPYITQEMMQDVLEVVGSEETGRCVGKGDVAIDPARVGAAATTLIAQQPQPLPPVGGAPQSVLHLPPAVPHVSAPPLHPSQVGLTPPPNPAFPHAGHPAAPAPVLPADNQAVPAKRTRTRKTAEPATLQGATQGPAPLHPAGPPATPAAPPPFLQTGQNAANATAPINPPATDAALDEMLRKAMSA